MPLFRRLAVIVLLLCSSSQLLALDPQPRMWSHLPSGSIFVAAAYANTKADINFDPALKLEDVTLDMDTYVAKFIYGFGLFDHSARIDITQGYQHGYWQGLVDGQKQSLTQEGMADSIIRFSVNLYGAPALSGKEFVQYRRKQQKETIIGTAILVRLPNGKYDNSRRVNLGSNRYTFRPQLGITHKSGAWTSELTGEAAIFSDNSDFYHGQTLDVAPLYIVHGHVIYSFKPGLWLGVSAGLDHGGKTKVENVTTTELQGNTGYALNFGYPLTPRSGLRVNAIHLRTSEATGADSETYSLSYSHHF